MYNVSVLADPKNDFEIPLESGDPEKPMWEGTGSHKQKALWTGTRGCRSGSREQGRRKQRV